MLRSLSVLAEKTVATFLEVFVTTFVAAGQFTNLDTWQSAGVAAVPAGLTVIANGLPQVELVQNNKVVDILFRTVRTYAVAFIGFLIAAPAFELSFDSLESAAIAAIPAGFAVVKGAISGLFGNKDTAAALPGKLDMERNI